MAEESLPADGMTEETDYCRIADDPLGRFMHCRLPGENVHGAQDIS
jgi:hypothetical protein